MHGTSTATAECAKLTTHKAGPSSTRNGAIHFVIVQKINKIFPDDTVKSLASWLDLTWKTAKNRIQGAREFSLEEVAQLLHSEHGFEILSALMAQAPRVPQWWRLCVPLMDLADAERMVVVVRKRTEAAIRNRDEVTDALETQIRRAQTLAIHGEEQAGIHADALRSLARPGHRMVAAKGRVR